MDILGRVLATLLPFVGLALVLAIILVTIGLSGWMGGWSLESLLMPVSWLATGLALVLLDRFLDRRIAGPGQKVVFVVGFWWVFVWSAALGAIVALVGGWGEQSGAQVTVTGTVVILLVVASIWAVRARFGYSGRR